jgi:hypothetical protein
MRAENDHDFYRRSLEALSTAAIPFLVGGAYALGHHAGIHRETKDLDLFIRKADGPAVIRLLQDLGAEAGVVARHWLGKGIREGSVIDVVWGFRNGVGKVEDDWFGRASFGTMFGVRVPFLSIEDMIWSKAFVMERDRYDGADIAHLLRAGRASLDWRRLVARFGPHWPVLLSFVILYRYVYPDEADPVPEAVERELIDRWMASRDVAGAPEEGPLCRGTLFSYHQYAVDLERGHRDARLQPEGSLAPDNLLE